MKVFKYGLSFEILQEIRTKIKNQRAYLEKSEFVTSMGQTKNLLDVSFSANHSERYYAQLANKINTMDNMALSDGLKPIFITATLDGFFRDCYRGNYDSRRDLIFEKIKTHKKFIPNNEIRGYALDKIFNKEQLNVKDLMGVLNHQMYKFLMSYTFKKMKKLNDRYMYIKTVEPHKDGVPHLHILFYVKEQHIEQFHKDFKKCFPAPRNQKKAAFQTDIYNASAYVLKYITKSFLDLKSDKELDYLQSWYVKHRIMRCVTSRSVVPQWIYKKAAIFEKDWRYLSDLVNSPGAEFDWSFEHNTFYIRDNELNRELVYTKGLFQVYSNGYKVKEIGSYVDNTKSRTPFEKTPNKWQQKQRPIPIYFEGQLYSFMYNKKEILYQQHISSMSDYDLIDTYHKYDIDNDSYTRFLSIRNLMIERDLLQGDQIGIRHNFNEDKFLFGK